jgi:hypothetical protein
MKGTTMIRTALAAMSASAVMLFGLAGCGDDDSSGATPAVADAPETEAVQASVPAPDPAPPPPGELAFTFTGEEGEAGCQYDGPDAAGTTIRSTVTNHSEGVVLVSMGRLADGATREDFIDFLGTLGDSYPVAIPQRLHAPAANPWVQGEWLELHLAGGGGQQTVDKESLFEGTYVGFCWMPNPDAPGSLLWPAGELTVRD